MDQQHKQEKTRRNGKNLEYQEKPLTSASGGCGREELMKQEAKKKRALLITLAVLLLVLVLGLAVYREATKDPVDRIMERMSLRDKLAQMMFFCPRWMRTFI